MHGGPGYIYEGLHQLLIPPCKNKNHFDLYTKLRLNLELLTKSNHSDLFAKLLFPLELLTKSNHFDLFTKLLLNLELSNNPGWTI